MPRPFPANFTRRRALALLLASGLAPRGFAGIPKPVPSLQALPLPDAEISFQREGQELARYHFGSGLKRPFVYPIVGPSGRSLTRMGHPHDPETHSHHNSVWISHQNVGGVNFWEDRPGPRIAHRRILRFEDGEAACLVETENAWLDKDETTLLKEQRRTAVRTLPERGEWLLSIDLQFEAPKNEVVLGQTPFGPIGVRMAKTIGVNDGGGTIRNSEGGVDEAGCFRQPARWVDYTGPIAPELFDGIALFDHPGNPNHPVPFHVRNDGWMGASLTFPGPLTIVPGTPLRLRYALYVHAGMLPPARIEEQWQRFAKTEFGEFVGKK